MTKKYCERNIPTRSIRYQCHPGELKYPSFIPVYNLIVEIGNPAFLQRQQPQVLVSVDIRGFSGKRRRQRSLRTANLDGSLLATALESPQISDDAWRQRLGALLQQGEDWLAFADHDAGAHAAVRGAAAGVIHGPL